MMAFGPSITLHNFGSTNSHDAHASGIICVCCVLFSDMIVFVMMKLILYRAGFGHYTAYVTHDGKLPCKHFLLLNLASQILYSE